MNEFDFGKAYSEVDGTIRVEVKEVMDLLLENCHTIDVMEQVVKEVDGLVGKLKSWSESQS